MTVRGRALAALAAAAVLATPLALHGLRHWGLADSAPFTIDGTGHLSTAVRLNGEGPFRFVLDTGAETSCVSRAVVDRAGLSYDENARVSLTSTGGVQRTGIYVARSFTTPIFRRFSERLVLLPGAAMGKDGVIGANVFADRRLEIDFAATRWRLGPSGRAPRGFTASSLGPSPGGKLAARITVDGVAALAVIDTGTRRTLANMALASALGLAPGDLRLVPANTVVGAGGGEIEAWSAEVDRLAIGGVELAHPTLTFADLPWWSASGLGDVPALALGLDQISRWRAVAIDFGRLELQVAR